MNITLFTTMLIIGSAISALLTEAVKKAFQNAGKNASDNLLALIDAIAVGGAGTATAYVLMGIEWNVNNILCLILMIFVVWVGSMIGYDKIIQLLKQIKEEK